MSLEDIPEVDFGSAKKGAFVIAHEQTTNKYYLRAVDGQGSHIPLYSFFFRGEVIAQQLPTALFCPKGGGFFEIDEGSKTITFSGASSSFGRFNEEILVSVLTKYFLQQKKEYSILIEPESLGSVQEEGVVEGKNALEKGSA